MGSTDQPTSLPTAVDVEITSRQGSYRPTDLSRAYVGAQARRKQNTPGSIGKVGRVSRSVEDPTASRLASTNLGGEVGSSGARSVEGRNTRANSRRLPASHRVPQRDAACSLPAGGPVAAPPCRPEGRAEVVAVRLSDGSLRLYRARPGCVTREEVETACWALAWRDGAGRWHSLVAGVELRAEETTWWDWALSVQGMRPASPAPPRPVAVPGRVAVDVVAWCQLAEGVRLGLRAWGIAKEPGLVVLGGEGLEAGDREQLAELLGRAGLSERDGVWEGP